MNGQSTAPSSGPDKPKQYGTTVPISEALPGEADLLQTQKLVDVLKSFDLFEDEQELQHRNKVIKQLETLFKEWLTEMCVLKDPPDVVTEEIGGKIFPYGSFHLGAQVKGADIDALCVGPEFVQREDFFVSFYEKLKSQKEVKNLRAVEESLIPVIFLNFDGIEIDLVYARVALRSIPENINLLDNNLINGMDIKCVRSMNGYKVAVEILRNVPDISNFQLALRAIKHWANRRNIYSNRLGFLGGVSWAIMVARVCQLYPNASAATLVTQFFRVFSLWKLPHPVQLKRVLNPGCDLPVWDPRVNRADRSHLMPIITPVYPQNNTSANVYRTTLTILKEEIKRGFEITQAIQKDKENWSTLFETPEFVTKYKHFVKLELTTAANEHCQWSNLMESKMRHLMVNLERNQLISLAHINPKTYLPSHVDGRKTTVWLVGLVLNMDIYSYTMVDLTTELQSFKAHVCRLAKASRMNEERVTMSAQYIVKENGVLNVSDEHQRVFGCPKPNPRPLKYAEARRSIGHQVVKRRYWDQSGTPAQKLLVHAGRGSEHLTCDSSVTPSVAQQGFKRPVNPQPGPPAKRRRVEDTSSNPSLVVVVREPNEVKSGPRGTKRPHSPVDPGEVNSDCQKIKRPRFSEEIESVNSAEQLRSSSCPL